MKKKLFCSILLVVLQICVGFSQTLKLNTYDLPDSLITKETPLLLSIQLIQDQGINLQINEHFFKESKKSIESAHRNGEISDSIFKIYQAGWDTVSFDAVQPVDIINQLTFEEKNGQNEWVQLNLNYKEIYAQNFSEELQWSNLIVLFMDPEEILKLRNKSIRVMTEQKVISNELDMNRFQYDMNDSTNDEERLGYIADCWFLAGDFEKAISYCDQLLIQNDRSMFGHYLKGASLFHLNNYSQSRVHLEKANLIYDQSVDISESPEFLFQYLDQLDEVDENNNE